MTSAAAVAHRPPPVVTIFEQYGAGADAVGRRVAEALAVPFHAQAFSSADLEAGEAALEQNTVLATVYAALGGAYGGFDGADVVSTQEQCHELVAANNRTVHELAATGGVLVGRNGAVVLADRPATLHVLLTGAVEDRVARAAREAGIGLEQAARRQAREDDVRARMSLVLYGWDPRLPDRYDLVVSTSRLPLEAVADVVVTAARAVAA
ncbi:cytidylate kinase-like family protein [Actinotalea solisilvae]|uniref:cytidylate kinase-like family protein n=1 Tax=Actinotalea solisilvae TaxID=2072922 RepID=UPI0018F16128|nr:cytidylate kinase-like family protein [Actinotalea solisilvae]